MPEEQKNYEENKSSEYQQEQSIVKTGLRIQYPAL